MYQELVIAAFVLVSLGSGGLSGGVPDWMPAELARVWAICLSPFAVLAFLGTVMSWRASRRVERGDLAAIGTLEATLVVLRVFAVLIHGVNCLVLGWPTLVRDAMGDIAAASMLAGALPPVLIIVACWWWMEPVERRLRHALIARKLHTSGLTASDVAPPHRSRFAYVWFWTRQSVLPVILPLAVISLWIQSVEHILAERASPGWIAAAQAVGAIAMLILGPFVLRRVWNTESLPDSSIRSLLASVCARSGVRVRDFLLWRTGGTMHNAAVLGFFGPARYILVTDAMVEAMPARALEAVAAHEVGHVRGKHLLWLGLSTLASALIVGALTAWLASMALVWAADYWQLTEAVGPLVRRSFELAIVIITFTTVIIAFGWVSRRLEWQADAFAAKDLSAATTGGPLVDPDAATRVSEALGLVAGYNGINPNRFMFRHGSIRARQRHVEHLIGKPLAALPIDAVVRRIKVLTVLGLLCAGGLTAWDIWNQPLSP
jgi:Zn-dependent protease with chaperone function